MKEAWIFDYFLFTFDEEMTDMKAKKKKKEKNINKI